MNPLKNFISRGRFCKVWVRPVTFDLSIPHVCEATWSSIANESHSLLEQPRLKLGVVEDLLLGSLRQLSIDGVVIVYQRLIAHNNGEDLKMSLPDLMHLVVSTLVPSGTGGVRRSTTMTLVAGYLSARARAVERPKIPAPMIMTFPGTVFRAALFVLG